MKRKRYIGVVLGAIYGIAFRLLCEHNIGHLYEYSVFSLTFVWILPVVIGLFPLIIAQEEIDYKFENFLLPQLAVTLFFLFTLLLE